MYGYAEYIELTPEQVLQKVSQQQIFEFAMKQPFDFNLRYCSTLREDKNPGCRFEQRPDGAIVFVDFGEKFISGHTHRSCFGMIMDTFNVSMNEAIRVICNHFKLSTSNSDYIDVDRVQYEKLESTQKTDITFEKKFASKSDIQYWSQFIIKPEHLIEDNVFCIRKFTVRNHKGFFTINTYKFAYAIDFIDKVKIYQPYKDKYKWISSCDENCIGNIDNLPPTGEELIIQKSYKDHRVLRNLNLGFNVIWFQNEGCVPSVEILQNLTERFKLITIFYDNDEDGILAAEKLVAIFNALRESCARMTYLPRKRKHKQLHGSYLKDPAVFIHKEGRQDLITVLKQIGLYANTT